jgi:4-hydroxybenzoate polyprenyltransferase
MTSPRLYWTFARPFTLVPPMVGIFSGSLIGYGASHVRFPVVHVALAVLAAAVLNAASNGLNQICDLQNDLINKPHRPLPSGRMTLRAAWTFVALTYLVALALVAAVNWETFVIYVIAAVSTVAYSAPPVRLKRHPVGSNLIIALIRGWLLKVAGWAAVATVLKSVEPWYIGFIYFVFLLVRRRPRILRTSKATALRAASPCRCATGPRGARAPSAPPSSRPGCSCPWESICAS